MRTQLYDASVWENEMRTNTTAPASLVCFVRFPYPVCALDAVLLITAMAILEMLWCWAICTDPNDMPRSETCLFLTSQRGYSYGSLCSASTVETLAGDQTRPMSEKDPIVVNRLSTSNDRFSIRAHLLELLFVHFVQNFDQVLLGSFRR